MTQHRSPMTSQQPEGLLEMPPHLKIIRTRPSVSDSHGGWKAILAFALSYLVLVFFTGQAFSSVPQPLPASAPPGLFSEGRALQTTSYLADTIGFRQVSTVGEEQAAQFLLAEAEALAHYAAEHRPDLDVIAVREQVSGAIGRQKVFGFEIANAYNNLTNIVLRISPRSEPAASRPALLMSAHYDSTLGSSGASDCASCVGVALEIARVLVSNASLSSIRGGGDSGGGLDSPAVFLFNGGEETLMQAAHGFMASSPFAKNLGAFINLESTGPWGPDVLFQHTGDSWTLRAYARAAPYPRGTTIAQDFFDLGVIPADTDFKMFAHKHYGNLPGIDVAFLFDGTAYHTARDETSRIRPGTLQAMGDNMLATALEYIKVLGTADDPARADSSDLLHNGGGQVYFDILCKYMVVYSHKAAAVLHSFPFAVLLVLSMTAAASTMSFDGQSPGWSTMPGAARYHAITRTIPPPGPLICLSARALVSTLLTILTPAIFGGGRVLMTGKPISWYGCAPAAYTMFVPAALVGALLPQIQKQPSLEESRSRSLGLSLICAATASLLTFINFHSAYVLAAWAGGGIAAAIFAQQPLGKDSVVCTPWPWRVVLPIVGCFVAPLTLSLPTSMSAADHVMEKIGLAGSARGPLGSAVPDAAVGAICGTAVLLGVGTALPYISGALGKGVKRVCLLLTAISLMAALWDSPAGQSGRRAFAGFVHIPTGVGVDVGDVSLEPQKVYRHHHQPYPYSHDHPKRVILQHIHRHTHDGRVTGSIYSFCSLDAVPVDAALPPAVATLPVVEFSKHDWEALYPLNYLVTGTARSAPPPPNGYTAPYLRARKFKKGSLPWLTRVKAWILTRILRSSTASASADFQDFGTATATTRWYFELDTVLPAWCVLNVTGNVAEWSLGPEVASKPKSYGNGTSHLIRYASGPYTRHWSFWVDVNANADEELTVELFVKHIEKTELLDEMVTAAPDWVSMAAVVTWQSTWVFS